MRRRRRREIFLPPIDGGHCPPSNFRRGALPPINFEILGIAPHQKFELSVPESSPPILKLRLFILNRLADTTSKFYEGTTRDGQFKFLMGAMPRISKLMGGNAPHRWGAKKICGAFGATKITLQILKLTFYCIFKRQFFDRW